MAENIVVSICTQTYNHESYIRQCLDGFISQKTNFKFEVLINDDASTDNTAQIVHEYELRYPDIIKPVYQTQNQYSQGINTFTTLLLPKAKGKYLALCEGDDYWCDENKLQKQVDFLEKNPDYNICWTRFKTLDDMTGQITGRPYEDVFFKDNIHQVNLSNLFNPYLTLTLTLLIRANILSLYNLNKFSHFKDNTIYAMALSNSKGAVLNHYSAVYRLHNAGVWSSSIFANQLSQDYYNFNEIYQNIEGAKTKHVREAKNLKLITALNKLHLHKGDVVLYKKLLLQMFKTGRFTNKVKYLLKYTLYRLHV